MKKKVLKEYTQSAQYLATHGPENTPYLTGFAKNKALRFISDFKDRFVVVDKTHHQFLVVFKSAYSKPKSFSFMIDFSDSIPFKSIESADRFIKYYGNLPDNSNSNVKLGLVKYSVIPVTSINVSDYIQMSKSEFNKKFLNDLREYENDDKQLKEYSELPRQHSRINPTGIAPKYWVAIDDHSDRLTNYSQFIDQSLNRKTVANNATPSRTVDRKAAVQLAKRAIAKWPDKYVFVGQDKSSYGMQTGMNHLRASTLYIWSPRYKMWNDFVDESKKLDEAMPTTANLNQAISLLDAIIAGNCEDEEDIYSNVENAYKLLTGTEHPASSTFSPQH